MSDAQEQVEELARALWDAGGSAVALTGAGVSTASEILAFRGEEGIWSRYDPHQHGHIDALHRRAGNRRVIELPAEEALPAPVEALRRQD